MSRPTDWSAAGQATDPTPGDPWGVRALASTYRTIADDAATARTIVSAVQSSTGGGVWLGEAADAFHARIGTFPSDIQKCLDSYGQASDAVSWWAARMESAQSNADRGLSQAIQAQSDLQSASSALASATAQQHEASLALTAAQVTHAAFQHIPAPPGVQVPSATQLRQLSNASSTASSAVSAASGSVADAQQRLDAARRLVAEAQSDYQSDASTVVARLNAAKDAGIKADNWWQSIFHSSVWSTIVKVATVVAVVAAVAAIFLTGPVGLLVAGIAFAAGAAMTANDAMAYGEGEESGGQLALSMATMFVPGGKALRGVEDGARLFEAADETATTATRAERLASAADDVARETPITRSTVFNDSVRVVEREPVTEEVRSSFKAGEYQTVVTEKPVTLYRVHGGHARLGGRYATTEPAGNRINAKLTAALLPKWKNTRQFESVIEVPAGQTLHIGIAGPQTIEESRTLLPGGADQVVLPQGWDTSWVKETHPLPPSIAGQIP